MTPGVLVFRSACFSGLIAGATRKEVGRLEDSVGGRCSSYSSLRNGWSIVLLTSSWLQADNINQVSGGANDDVIRDAANSAGSVHGDGANDVVYSREARHPSSGIVATV